MLRELHVSNFALIERLDLEFGPGLNILTGETGAGKSILIDAINAILGERVGSDVIRTGADRCMVEGVFDTQDAPHVAARLLDEGLDDDENLLLLTRELSRSGQGSARVNGRRTTVGVLRTVGDGLVNLHGQHEHQTLLAVDRHLEILDAWGGAELESLRLQVQHTFSRWRRLEEELKSLQMDERERARRVDLFSFQVQEIEDAKLAPGEEEELLVHRNRLASAEKLAAGAASAKNSLNGDTSGALDAIGQAVSTLRDLVKLDPSLGEILAGIEGSYFTIQEAAHELGDYLETVEFRPDRVEEVEERLDVLRRMKKKYGDTVDEILAYRVRISQELDALHGADARLDELQAEIKAVHDNLDILNRQLRAARLEAGESLRRAMERELGELAMEKTRFEVQVEPAEPSPRGADRVEFLIAPNPGEPLKPLARIVSGGELSRLMLALKSVVAKADPVPVLIFDEIDVGVSGRVAGVIARKLRRLSLSSQVLCVTHLPQIAAAADQHFHIRKVMSGERTVTRVDALDEPGRMEEIARIVAGATPTETARTHARELMAEFRGDPVPIVNQKATGREL